MHGQHVFFRQQEVLHREHGLLHFPGVTHAGDQHAPLGELEDDATVGVGAVTCRIALEVGGMQDFPLTFAARIVLFRTNEQGVGKQVVPRGLRSDLDGDVVIRRGTHMQVRDELIFAGCERGDALPEGIEFVSIEGAIDRAPVDTGAGAGLIHDEAIHR